MMQLILSMAMAVSSAVPTLPSDLPNSTDAMAQAAAADPAAYRDVLLNCAAAQGVVALVKGKAGMSTKGHDDMAIVLMHVATTLPPKDEWAVSQAYGDKLFAFNQALQEDKTGTVQFDLLKLTQACAVVEQYADATTAKEMAANPAPANPMFDDKQREDIIAQLMGASEPEPAAEPLLDEEQAIVAPLFADGTDYATAYRGMLMDCAAYHGLRAERSASGTNVHTVSVTTFLSAAVLVLPDIGPRVDADHDANMARYRDALAHDTTGEIEREMVEIASTCATIKPVAELRILKAKAAADVADHAD